MTAAEGDRGHAGAEGGHAGHGGQGGHAGHAGHGGKAIIAAFFANLGIALAKFAGFVVTGSASMLAESVHSLADTGNQGLLMLGGRRARRPASEKHPFGHGAERYFWAFVVAVVLFTLGAAFAVVEGFEKILHPHELESPGWAIGILIVAIGLESFSMRTAYKEMRAVHPTGSMWSFIRHSKSAELPVVLLEDLAALTGLLFALIAVALSLATDDAVWDGFGTLSIGLLLGVVAMILAREMKSLLIGEAADAETRDEIRAAIESHPKIERMIHLRTRHLGPDDLLIAAKIGLPHHLDSDDVADAIDQTEAAIRDVVPEATLIFLEPDVFDPEQAAAH